MNKNLFEVQELESRFEMEVMSFDDGSSWDASADQGSEAANAVCCQNYTCIGTVRTR
ncbi:MAG: hypothetical protein IPK97_03825 [Ahniella sp.]|nr:hypothetical protein [Ahniella sp.]